MTNPESESEDQFSLSYLQYTEIVNLVIQYRLNYTEIVSSALGKDVKLDRLSSRQADIVIRSLKKSIS